MPLQTSIPSDDPVEAAAHWCMRLHADDCTDVERAAFDRWLKSDPSHADEYQAMLEIWLVSEHLPGQTAQSAPPQPVAEPRRRTVRPSMATAAAFLFLSASTLLSWHQGWVPNSVQRYQADEAPRTVTLADGSHIQLNQRTTLWFANFRDRRSVTLTEGEAFFDVQHNADHPFIVNAGTGDVTVTGTQFNVWKYREQVVVTLTEGSVKVRNKADISEQIAYLTPGLQARYGNSVDAPQIARANPDALAWRDGKLVFNDLPLAEALPLINRYLDKPVLLANRDTANLHIGGIYDIRNLDEMVQALPKVLPVKLSRTADGNTVISLL